MDWPLSQRIYSPALATKAIGDVDHERGIIKDVVITTDEWDRQGDKVSISGIDWKAYRKNPIILWLHNMALGVIGKAFNIRVQKSKIVCDVQFDLESELAAKTFRQYARGFLRAWSIGLQTKRSEVMDQTDGVGNGSNVGRYLAETEAIEISATPAGANRSALTRKSADGGTELDTDALDDVMGMLDDISPPEDPPNFEDTTKGAIPYSVHGDAKLADEGASWSAAKEVKAVGDDYDRLKKMCAWYDANESEVKSSYKLPHHRASDLAVVWKGVAAAYAAVKGARGGADIPASDKAAVLAHLKKHYKQFDKDWPEKAAGDLVPVLEAAPGYAPGAWAKSLSERGAAGKIPVTCEIVEEQKDAGVWFRSEPVKQRDAGTNGPLVTEARVTEVLVRSPKAAQPLAGDPSRVDEPLDPEHSMAAIKRAMAAVDVDCETLDLELRALQEL